MTHLHVFNGGGSSLIMTFFFVIKVTRRLIASSDVEHVSCYHNNGFSLYSIRPYLSNGTI